MEYRRDIDGLRAVAILTVVLFHFHVPGFSGGFTGVDVFFVLSGFLITSVLERELSAGTFSLASFYERRARRLFPALYCMLLCSIPLAVHFLMAADYGRFVSAFAAASAFFANIFFWRTTTYFDTPGEQQPLLHTWSLSVEEQFYLVFPSLLLALRKWLPRRALVPTLVATTAGSFYWTHEAAITKPGDLFYLPGFRAWELCLGATVATLPSLRFRAVPLRWLYELLAATGLGLIVLSATRLSEGSGWPYPVPFHACLGTALLLYTGAAQRTLVSRLLGSAPLVFTGLISYSLYLWHWPVWVFGCQFLVLAPTLSDKCWLMALALALALVSTRWIERPFRGGAGLGTRRQILVGSVLLIGAAAGLGPKLLPPLQRPISAAAAAIANVELEPMPFPEHPTLAVAQSPACRLGAEGVPRTFLLWGDSHAGALAEGISEAARAAKRAGMVMYAPGCPPLRGVDRRLDGPRGCARFNDSVTELLRAEPGIDTVFLAARWALFATGQRDAGEAGPPVTLVAPGVDSKENLPVVAHGLEQTLSFLNGRGVRVVVFDQVPEVGFRVPAILARARQVGRPPPAGVSLAAYQERQRSALTMLERLQGAYRFELVDLSQYFCRTGQCIVQAGGLPLYLDNHHLSMAGSRWLVDQLGLFH